MTPEQKLQSLGIELPVCAKPVGAYVPAVRTGNLVLTAGQLPMKDGTLTASGKTPDDVSLQDAQLAARQALLNALSALRAEAESLDNVSRIVRLNVLVNSSPGFTDQAQVANGASDLLLELFGEAGRHTRTAVGAAELPLNAPVELDITAEISV
ncbi:MAG: RidA family protein [Phycisphaerae bacterium]|nr:RidA family protein [Phycisphaerae bacterium]MDP7288905.1 RidA family protein [Phycisphaerae bacterium]